MQFKMFLRIAVILVCFFLFGCASNKFDEGMESIVDNPSVSTNSIVSESDSRYQERKRILENWINAIDKDNVIAINTAKNLRKILYLAEPAYSFDGDFLIVRVLEKVSDLKMIPVISILPEDEDVSVSWEYEIRSIRVGVSYISDFPLLILVDGKISNFWKGIIMFQEGNNIISSISGIFDSIEDPLERNATREYRGYSVIFQILDQKGGEKYKEIRAEKTVMIKKYFLEKGEFPEIDFSEANRLNDAFEEFPLLEDEIIFRWGTLWLHSIFVAIEEMNKGNEERKKKKIDYIMSLLKIASQ